MALHALRAAVLALIPSVALAQTSAVTVKPTQVDQADCGGTGNVSVTWTTTYSSGDMIRVVAAGSCPSSPPAESTAGTLGADVTPISATQTATFSVASINAAVSANCASINDTVVNVCVYKLSGSSTGSSAQVGSATFTFQTAIPPAPVNVSASPANSAIDVSYGPGTTGGNYQANTSTYIVEYAVSLNQPDGGPGPDGGTQTWSQTGATSATTLRINGLTNGVTYDARVIGLSDAGNQGPVSVTVSETPQPFDDYWTRYKDANGREQGGCGAGGAGALATLLLALAVFLRRRG